MDSLLTIALFSKEIGFIWSSNILKYIFIFIKKKYVIILTDMESAMDKMSSILHKIETSINISF